MASNLQARNRRVALASILGAAAMLGLAFASVPLYRLFCQATGFGGTVQRADAAPARKSAKTMLVRFDANVAASLGWSFTAEQAVMEVRIGEENLAHYRAVNTSDRAITGSAVFNVTPEAAGAYFNKIQCFCFTEQTLAPGESADLPVSFFVDPDILEDADAKNVGEITLSYTFYPVDKPKTVSSAETVGVKMN